MLYSCMFLGKPSQTPAHAIGNFQPRAGFNLHGPDQTRPRSIELSHVPSSRPLDFQTTGTNLRRINTSAKPDPQLSQNQHFQFVELKVAQNQHLRKWWEGVVCCCVAPEPAPGLLDGLRFLVVWSSAKVRLRASMRKGGESHEFHIQNQ